MNKENRKCGKMNFSGSHSKHDRDEVTKKETC